MSSAAGNRLIQQCSPYLQRYVHGPVDWYPWGEEALARARRERRPILLLVGHWACHWCQVMERESFQDPEIAQLMNDNFVCVLVDREERPDLDSVAAAAAAAMSGTAGWPLTLFLTPRCQPFFAGTYFPPRDTAEGPGLATLLGDLAAMWAQQPDELETQAERMVSRLKNQARLVMTSGRLEPGLIELAASDCTEHFDERFGGFGDSPRVPPATILRLLLRHHRRSGDTGSLEMVRITLEAMARGGIYDHLGGGFASGAVDRGWLVPRFDKSLCDNALLARTYLEAFELTSEPLYARIAAEVLDFVGRDMTTPEGGFLTGLRVDPQGETGALWLWSPELVAELLEPGPAEHFCAYFDVRPEGNFEGRSILNAPRSLEEVARTVSLEPSELESELAESVSRLHRARRDRSAPELDDRVLTAHNGLMLGALAEAHRVLGRPDSLKAARRAADFLWNRLRDDQGRLLRVWRDGQARLPAYLEDHAFLAQGLLDLHRASGDEIQLERALRLAEQMVELFRDPETGGFFDTTTCHDVLMLRSHSGADRVLPSPNAVAASVLARLAAASHRPEWEEMASRAVAAYARDIRTSPMSFSRSLMVLDSLLDAGPRGQAGRATPQATATAARGGVKLAHTDLTISHLGFDCARVDDETPAHREALQAALSAGVNLIDCSGAVAGGASERLVGEVLGGGRVDRQGLVLLSRIGYVHGQNLELAERRKQRGRPFPEMVEYSLDCWHCIHPEWLEDQLKRTLERLDVCSIDVCLLHDPEYFLAHGGLAQELYRRLEQAFEFLEQHRQAGRIGVYGLCSEGLVTPESRVEHLSLLRVLEVAGPGFGVIQVPLNLLESGALTELNNGGRSLLEVARSRGLAVLTTRPLVAFTEDGPVRLAEVEPPDDESDLEAELVALGRLEQEYHELFDDYVAGPGSEALFRFAEQLQGLEEVLSGQDHWHQLEEAHIRPALQSQVVALNQAVAGPLAQTWVDWRDRYLACFRDVMNAFDDAATRISSDAARRVATRIDPLLPASVRQQSLSRKALWIVASTPGVSCVLNGMRDPDYVRDSVAVLDWEPAHEVEAIYSALGSGSGG